MQWQSSLSKILNNYVQYTEDLNRLAFLVKTYARQLDSKMDLLKSALELKLSSCIRLEINHSLFNTVFSSLLAKRFNYKVVSLKTHYEIFAVNELGTVIEVLDTSMSKVGKDAKQCAEVRPVNS